MLKEMATYSTCVVMFVALHNAWRFVGLMISDLADV